MNTSIERRIEALERKRQQSPKVDTVEIQLVRPPELGADGKPIPGAPLRLGRILRCVEGKWTEVASTGQVAVSDIGA